MLQLSLADGMPILRMIPRYPLSITRREIAQKLNEEGFAVTSKTIEWDVKALEGLFALDYDSKAKPFLKAVHPEKASTRAC